MAIRLNVVVAKAFVPENVFASRRRVEEAALLAVMPSDDVDTKEYWPFAPPMRTCPYCGVVEVPVHPRKIGQTVALSV
jgi:hypothetical protein